MTLAEARRSALLCVGRRLLASGARTLGLVPVNDHVSVPRCARILAEVLNELDATEVVLVDAGLGARHYDASGPLGPRLRVLRPAATAEVVDLVELFGQVADEPGRFLIDLTGYRDRGVLSWTFEPVDGVLLVASAGKVTDHELMVAHRDAASARWVGVVLFSTLPDVASDHPVDQRAPKEY